MGGKNGFYYHFVIDNYSHYPEVSIVLDTKFSTLKPVLEEIWSRWRYPDKVIHDGGPPYNSHKWQMYMEEIGVKTDICTPEHRKSNGMVENMMGNLVNITHYHVVVQNYFRDPNVSLVPDTKFSTLKLVLDTRRKSSMMENHHTTLTSAKVYRGDRSQNILRCIFRVIGWSKR